MTQHAQMSQDIHAENFQAPVFVTTSRPREAWKRQGGRTFTFVKGGIESAIELACSAAGAKDVHVAGGANVVQQALNTALLDELQIHLAPVLLGGGVRLLDRLDSEQLTLGTGEVVVSPSAIHLTYRVERR